MPRSSPIITSFVGGELSPYLYGRTDLSRYFSSCRRVENFIPLPQGAAERRGGTRFVAQAKYRDRRVRLLPFEFSDDQTYCLEVGHLYLRIYTGKRRIDVAGAAYELVTPYTEEHLADLALCQSADVLYIVHPHVRPHKLSRYGHTNWTLTPVSFVDGPYLEENTTATTLSITPGEAGMVTITASDMAGINGGDGFLVTDVGRHVRIGHIAPAWTASTDYAADAVVRNAGAVYRCTTGGTSAASGGPTSTDGAITDGTVIWEYIAPGGIRWGYATITAFEGVFSVRAAVGTEFVSTEAVATWRLGLWSDSTGWPAAVTFHEERLVFGSATKTRPQRVDASKTGDFETFSPGTQDGDPLAFSIGSNKVNKIRWLASMRALLVGTMGAEFVISAEQGAPLTPSNLSARPHARNGCAPIAPVEVGNAVLYVQRQGRRLCELTYRFATDSYGSNDLTLLADHVAVPGLTELAWQLRPHGVVWALRSDGQLLGCTYLPEQEVTAWHRHPMSDAVVESICVIGGAGGSDELWLAVKRTIGGALYRTIEVMEDPLPLDGLQDNAFYVDCGLSYSGGAATTISGLEHLEGAEVAILADGAVHPRRTVRGGQITLDWPAETAHVGLPYRSILHSMELDAGQAEGTAQGKPKRIGRATVRMLRSLGGMIGRDEENLEPILHDRHPDTPMNAPPPLFTGDRVVPFPGDWGTDGSVLLVQDDPLPLTVNAIMPRVVTSDG